MDQFAGDLPWFVVRTRAHKDTIALCELRKQGVFVFCPMIRKTIRRARRLVDRQIPLFPGYIFISFEPEVCLVRAVNSTRGVRSLLVNEAGRPGRVPPAFVRELQAHTREDGLFTFRHSFSRGEKVRVDSGAFAGLLGQIEELGDGGRAKVLLHLMSREVTVNLSADDLRRIT